MVGLWGLVKLRFIAYTNLSTYARQFLYHLGLDCVDSNFVPQNKHSPIFTTLLVFQFSIPLKSVHSLSIKSPLISFIKLVFILDRAMSALISFIKSSFYSIWATSLDSTPFTSISCHFYFLSFKCLL